MYIPSMYTFSTRLSKRSTTRWCSSPPTRETRLDINIVQCIVCVYIRIMFLCNAISVSVRLRRFIYICRAQSYTALAFHRFWIVPRFVVVGWNKQEKKKIDVRALSVFSLVTCSHFAHRFVMRIYILVYRRSTPIKCDWWSQACR